MAVGQTITGSLTDSLPTIIAAARIVAEYEGVMQRLAERHTLDEGTGLTWHEVSFAKLTGQDITETTELENPQQLSDTDFSITPTVIAIHTVVTDRVRARISKNALAQIGKLAQNAIERRKNEDGHTLVDSATAHGTPGSGQPVEVEDIQSAVTVTRFGGGNEPSNPPHYVVLHPYGIYDLTRELTPIGSIEISEGMSARVFKEGFMGNINGAQVFEDSLISIDSTPDAKGGAFAKMGVVLVQGRARRPVTIRNEKYGGGADEMLIYDEFAYGERSSGNWVRELAHDATAPTG